MVNFLDSARTGFTYNRFHITRKLASEVAVLTTNEMRYIDWDLISFSLRMNCELLLLFKLLPCSGELYFSKNVNVTTFKFFMSGILTGLYLYI